MAPLGCVGCAPRARISSKHSSPSRPLSTDVGATEREPPPKRKRSLLGLRAYLWDQWLDAGLCGSNQTRCWAYDTLFCEPPVHPSWPFVLSTMIRRCTMSSPSMRPSAAQNLKTLEDVRDALIQRDDAIGAAVRGSPTSM